jgi:hypothetical protein
MAHAKPPKSSIVWVSRKREDAMAKGQKKRNREARKPKKGGAKTIAPLVTVKSVTNPKANAA